MTAPAAIHPAWLDSAHAGRSPGALDGLVAIQPIVAGVVAIQPIVAGVVAVSERWRELDTLTPAQLNVVLACAGTTNNREIGAALGISEQTAKNHLGDAMRRLGLEGTPNKKGSSRRLVAMAVSYVLHSTDGAGSRAERAGMEAPS